MAIDKFGDKTVVGSEAELFAVFESPPPETLAVLVMLFVPTAVPNPTLTEKLKTLVLFPATFEIAVELAQVITCGEAALELQDQAAAFVPPGVTVPAVPPLTVKPTGSVSVTVTVPTVAAVPLFAAVSV